MKYNHYKSIVIIFILLFLLSCKPKNIPVENIKIEITEERVSRGKYLAVNVHGCISCHSQRDKKMYAMPFVPGTEGMGRHIFDETVTLTETVYSKNITPAGLSNWSDGEIFRAIVSGISKDGTALFAIMPFDNYKIIPRENIYDIIAYLRTLKPIFNEVPKVKIEFPMNIIINLIPEPYKDPKPLNVNDKVDYGKYLTETARCLWCHTKPQWEQPFFISKNFGGGNIFKLNGRTIISANLTPDMATGIGNKSVDNFIGMFRAFASEDAKTMRVPEDEDNTVMPWTDFAGMKDQELIAIYEYLRTVKAVSNQTKSITN